jgi:hypothetical protein
MPYVIECSAGGGEPCCTFSAVRVAGSLGPAELSCFLLIPLLVSKVPVSRVCLPMGHTGHASRCGQFPVGADGRQNRVFISSHPALIVHVSAVGASLAWCGCRNGVFREFSVSGCRYHLVHSGTTNGMRNIGVWLITHAATTTLTIESTCAISIYMR